MKHFLWNLLYSTIVIASPPYIFFTCKIQHIITKFFLYPFLQSNNKVLKPINLLGIPDIYFCGSLEYPSLTLSSIFPNFSFTAASTSIFFPELFQMILYPRLILNVTKWMKKHAFCVANLSINIWVFYYPTTPKTLSKMQWADFIKNDDRETCTTVLSKKMVCFRPRK